MRRRGALDSRRGSSVPVTDLDGRRGATALSRLALAALASLLLRRTRNLESMRVSVPE
jgi:hypothetical protein